MRCKQCGADSPADSEFCRECGIKLEPMSEPVPVPGEAGAFYCARHKKEATRVRCSRCDTPICPRCMVPAPVGILCRDCARRRVPIRARGVLHEAGEVLGDTTRGAGRAVWYLGIWGLIISIIRSLFGGRDT